MPKINPVIDKLHSPNAKRLIMRKLNFYLPYLKMKELKIGLFQN